MALGNLEDVLIGEYNGILDEEALLWQQKSRLKWLQEGDRNTKFFHMTTIIRRRCNKIERWKNCDGEADLNYLVKSVELFEVNESLFKIGGLRAQTTKLPVSICEDLDRLNRNFFWEGSDRKKKVHLCQWNIMYRPKAKVVGFQEG
ncbi:unnamed protein product [Prunus armeniaca]